MINEAVIVEAAHTPIGSFLGALSAVMLADSMVCASHAEIMLAGGMEPMSMAPYALLSAR